MKATLRRFSGLLAALLLTLSALAGGLWLWSGSAGSLAAVLSQLPRLLPTGQTLQTREVSGSLRQGGHIGWLRWQQGALIIEVQDLNMDWQPGALWQGQLHISHLTLAHLRVDDQRASDPDAIATPPGQLGLPLKIDARVAVGTLEWLGASSIALDKLAFHYAFDGDLHRLDNGQTQFSSTTYGFSGQVQARGPMALALQANAVLTTPLPGSATLLNVAAKASLSGSLAGPNARLALQAALIPQWPASQARRSAMQASLSAELAPWQPQKIISAQGQWQALDLAALWPQAPQTSLQGQAWVRPQGPGWQARIALKNALIGPWNQQRLPLQSLSADLTYSEGRWLLQSLQAQGASGSIVAKGQLNPLGIWQGQATVQDINPAAIDSRLASDKLSGTLSARQGAGGEKSGDGIAFDIALQTKSGHPSPLASNAPSDALQTLHLQRLTAQGLWSAPLLTLHSLRIDAREAQLQGQLSYQSASGAMQGQLDLSLPGLQAALKGDLASTNGQGTLTLGLQDATLANRWLTRWPGMASILSGIEPRGTADLTFHWQGGWQNHAQNLTFDTSLRAPELHWTPRASTTSQTSLSQLQLKASGTPGKFSVTGTGVVQAGLRQLDWQTQVSASRSQSGTWQGAIEQLKLALHEGTSKAAWHLELGAAPDQPSQTIALNWQPGATGQTVTLSPGRARLFGPLAGSAALSWQAMRWSQSTPQGKSKSSPLVQWQSQGRIDQLPLAWLDAFSGRSMADLGLSSDLLLSGSWDAAQTDTLRLRATLARSSGDLHLRTDLTAKKDISADIQDAWLQLNLDAGRLAGSLRWDSLRAGKAIVAASTELQLKNGDWVWPDNAPLAGSLQLQLPPVDAWSALAPPGWRLRGTVNADIKLSGSVNLPQWDGTLQARDLALRSVVDGIDFSRGTLDARLHGQQLDISNFTLQGASGGTGTSEGGQLSITGSVFLPTGGGHADLPSRIQMALQAQLTALRLSARPDRRMVVSGKLSAELKEAKLTLRGALSADQALLTLPDDNTPTLGDDVVVRQGSGQKTSQTSSNAVNTDTPPRTRTDHDLLISLDLGPDFQVRGRGLQARLAGKLDLSARSGAPLGLIGAVRTASGSYQAYGQKLDIEQGVLRFTGPIDNPAVTILAIRPKLTQRVGVQISGTALSPIVRLYADPDLPDAEKLAWLVLGRSASGGGAEAALMQQAAMTLLSGNGKSLSDSLSQAFGLDELSFRGSATAGDPNSSSSASGASVTLGKRLSKDFYATYQHSLNGTMGVLYIFYDLSKRLTLRTQTGEQSAVDLIFTLRYD